MSHDRSDVTNDWLLSLQSAERGSCKIHQSTPITDSLSMSLTLSAISLATDSNTSCLDPNTDESTRSEPVLKLTENLPKIPVSRANRRRTDGQGDVKGNGLVARKSKSKLLPVPGVVERKRTRLGAEKPTSSGKKGEIAVGGGTAALRYKPPSLLHKRDTPVLKMTSGTASQSVLKMTSGAASQSVLKMTSGTASQSVLKMTSGAASQSVLKMTRGAASSPETKNSKNRLNERRAIVAVKNTLANSSLKSNKRPSAIGVPKLNLTHSSNKIAPPTIQNGADGNTSVCKLKQTQKSKACPVKADVTLPGSATHHVRRMLSTSTTVQAPSGVTVRNRLSAQGRLITAISRKSSSPEPTSRSSCGSVNSIKSISGDDGQARPAGGKGEILWFLYSMASNQKQLSFWCCSIRSLLHPHLFPLLCGVSDSGQSPTHMPVLRLLARQSLLSQPFLDAVHPPSLSSPLSSLPCTFILINLLPTCSIHIFFSFHICTIFTSFAALPWLDISSKSVLPLSLFLIRSTVVTPHIHLNIFFSDLQPLVFHCPSSSTQPIKAVQSYSISTIHPIHVTTMMNKSEAWQANLRVST